jgi:ubiquinone/menaquinone biosynthesis C-methylase UbiE
MRQEMQRLFEIGYDAAMTRRRFLLLCTFVALAATALAQDTFQTETERLAKLLDWKLGSAIADIGAGDGEITLLLSDRVGLGGRVYSTEIDESKLKRLQGLTAARENVTVLKGGAEQSNLEAGCCDSILVRRVYHHFPNPSKMDASLFAALKPGGTLAIIDFEDRQGLPDVHECVPKNRGHHGISRAIIIEEITAAGLEQGPHPTDWPNGDYCLIFRKPK